MRKHSNSWRTSVLVLVCGALLGFNTGCLPENFFSDQAGNVVSGLVISGLNLALTDSGLQI